MNRFLPLFDEELMLDQDESGWGEFAWDDEENISDDDDDPEMELDMFRDEPPQAQGTSPEGKTLYTEEQYLEGLRRKAKEERKTAYVTPEKKKKASAKKGLLSLALGFLKNGPNRSLKPKAGSTPNPVEVAASGGLAVTS